LITRNSALSLDALPPTPKNEVTLAPEFGVLGIVDSLGMVEAVKLEEKKILDGPTAGVGGRGMDAGETECIIRGAKGIPRVSPLFSSRVRVGIGGEC